MWMGIPFPFEYPVYAILMLKSLVMSLAATAAVILIAYPMAYFLAFRVTRYKALWIIIITIPVLDQLSAARLFLEDHAGLQRRHQLRPDEPRYHLGAAGASCSTIRPPS